MSVARVDHLYTYGDLYETVDACDQLELLLGRLRRQRLLGEQDWLRNRNRVLEIRSELEERLRDV
ncbi:MAG: hypothetical protein JOZ41_17820 [Chloroflexi bacterium]|nr:hypothetical protein [Chloroflexota bacterium]